jgi:polysaccharide biosynthesis protein PslH
VDLVDVDSEKWLQYAAECRGMLRWLYRVEGNRLRRLEASLPARAMAITLVSSCEAALYRSFCATDLVHAIPNGVDLDYFHPCSDSSLVERQNCVFVGALDYRANLDGVNWFCSEVWPDVRRRRPDARFTLVGSNPSPLARRLAERPGICLAENVPDVRPYLADAALVVVPLRIARGIQNKVLEALAMGKAVIATPQALEGIGVESGVHVRAARTPAEWTEAIVSLLDDRPARDCLGGAGRKYVETHHCWDRQLRSLAELLRLPAPSPQAVNLPASHG